MTVEQKASRHNGKAITTAVSHEKSKFLAAREVSFRSLGQNGDASLIAFRFHDLALNGFSTFEGVQLPDVCTVDTSGYVSLKPGEAKHQSLHLCHNVLVDMTFTLK